MKRVQWSCLFLLLTAAGIGARVFSASDEDVTTLTSADTLKVPDVLKSETVVPFTVAQTPPTVDVYIFKDLPASDRQTLWSSWGDGCLASNGRYYTSIGNHLDLFAKGESRVYEYDPTKKKKIRQIINVRDVIPDGKIAAGKIHARIDEGKDVWLYFTTYWGKVPKEQDWQNGFRGSVLLRYDPRTGKTEDLGVPVPQQGLPTSLMDTQRMLMYCYAVYSGDFVVYDLTKRAVKYRGNGDDQEGNRNIMLDADGNAYFSGKDGFLSRYNPTTNQVTPTKAQLPDMPPPPAPPARGGERRFDFPPFAGGAGGGGTERARREGRFLRASTHPAKNGVIYGMTQAGAMFAFDPKRDAVKSLGLNFAQGEYTAVMELSADDKYLYYVPGAHGSGARIGCPVVQYNVATGQRKVLAFLNPILRERFKYNLGGTYNMKMSRDGSQLFITFNGAPLQEGQRREETFGLPSLVVLHIPPVER